MIDKPPSHLLQDDIDHYVDDDIGTLSEEDSLDSSDSQNKTSSIFRTRFESPWLSDYIKRLDYKRDTFDPTKYKSLDKFACDRKAYLTPSLASNKEWKDFAGHNRGFDLRKICSRAFNERTQDEKEFVVRWLMSKWSVGNDLGVKKCMKMVESMKYFTYKKESYIITEGEAGQTFHIVVHGDVYVHKKNVGVVAHLGAGVGFGQVRLRVLIH